jgi:hypothetical protein
MRAQSSLVERAMQSQRFVWREMMADFRLKHWREQGLLWCEVLLGWEVAFMRNSSKGTFCR